MKKIEILLYIVYAIVVLTAAAYSLLRPAYNWDVLPYIASMYSLESNDTNYIHTLTYGAVKSSVDEKTFIQLTSGEYRKAMADCAKCFMEQLPFYKIKALYVLLIFFFYKLNIDIVRSTVLISVISYVLINFICLFWLRKVTNKQTIFIFTAIIFAIFPFLLNSASDSAPNMLSALFVLSAFYVLFKKKSVLFCILMLLAVFTRPDNIILLFISIIALYIYKNKDINISKPALAITFIASIALFQGINMWSGNYNWKILFEHSFNDRLITPAEHISDFNILIYLKSFLKWPVMLKFSGFSVQALIFILTLYMLKCGKKFKEEKFKEALNPEMLILLITGASIIIHYLLYPIIEDNYFTAQYLITDIIFIKTIIEKFSAVNYPTKSSVI